MVYVEVYATFNTFVGLDPFLASEFQFCEGVPARREGFFRNQTNERMALRNRVRDLIVVGLAWRQVFPVEKDSMPTADQCQGNSFRNISLFGGI